MNTKRKINQKLITIYNIHAVVWTYSVQSHYKERCIPIIGIYTGSKGKSLGKF